MNDTPKIIKKANIVLGHEDVTRLRHRYKSARGQEDAAVEVLFQYVEIVTKNQGEMERRLAVLEARG